MNLSLKSTHTQQAGHDNGKAVALCWHCLLQFALSVWQLLCPAYSHGKNIWSAFKLQRNYVSISLSLWAKVAHNLSFIIAFVLCTNLEVLSTLRLSRNGHSLPPFPPSLGFSLTPPYPNIQKCWAFSEHLTLSDTVQVTNERILQRSCCEKLMITPTWYTIPTPLPSANT